MSRKIATTLAVLLVLGTASAALADANNRADHLSSFDQRPALMMSNVNDAGEPFATEKNTSFAGSHSAIAQRPPFRRGITGKTVVWIKLTEPGGDPGGAGPERDIVGYGTLTCKLTPYPWHLTSRI